MDSSTLLDLYQHNMDNTAPRGALTFRPKRGDIAGQTTPTNIARFLIPRLTCPKHEYSLPGAL